MSEFGVEMSANKKKQPACFFDNRSGGYYVTQQGHNYNKDELDAARYLALNGYQVIMQPEGDGSGGVSLRINMKTGSNTYPEGKIGNLWYEQFSTFVGGANAVKKGLIHAHGKSAEIAVIYDKGRKLHREDIEEGISRYKRQSTTTPKTLFSKILIITKLPKSKKWGVYEWHL